MIADKNLKTHRTEGCPSLCSVTSLEKRVEGFDIDADPSGWQPYFSFVEALREKIMRAEPIGKTFILWFNCMTVLPILPVILKFHE